MTARIWKMARLIENGEIAMEKEHAPITPTMQRLSHEHIMEELPRLDPKPLRSWLRVDHGPNHETFELWIGQQKTNCRIAFED